MRLQLERWADTPYGTFGTLTLPDDWTCYTLELPWRDNQPGISCIPAGLYALRVGMYYKGGYPALELLDVPGRSQIKVHRANVQSDLEGCIAPGRELGVLRGDWAVLNSGSALDHIMAAGPWTEIEIRWRAHA